MQIIDPVLQAYFASGQPIVEESYVWIVGRDLVSGDEEPFGYWTGEYTQTFSVYNRRLSLYENRQYVGNGAIEVVPIISGSSSLQSLDAISMQFAGGLDDVQDNIRGKNLRRAWVEIHKGYYDPQTTKLIASPMLVYIGLVNDGDEDIPAASPTGESDDPSSISLTFIPHLRGFKSNAKTRSNQTGRARSNDTIYKLGNIAGGWPLRWGKERKKVGRNKGKNSGKNKGK